MWVNTVKTDLENLKATVEGLDGVKTLSYADGMLIIETGKGTKVEVPVPSATGVTTVELKDNVLYVDGKEAGKVEITEGEAVKVEVKEDGKLYINDEVQDLEIGSKVVMVDNGNGSYTMTVDGTSYVLPKYSPAAAITSVEFETAMTTFQNVAYTIPQADGISWNLAATNVDWKGPKGAVKRNDLLVGQITTVNVQVTPASFDMTTPGLLSLKDSKGNVAPVKVTAVANNKLITTSRSANASGSWLLSIEMNDEIDATNIREAFEVKPNVLRNYALCVAGTPVSAYDITIKMRDKVDSHENDLKAQYDCLSYIDEEGLDASVKNDNVNKLPIGTTALTVTFKSIAYADHLYDSYITFEGSNQSLAKARGIVANGMSITAPASAAGTVITATIHMIDITGKEFTAEQEFTVASSAANAVEADAVKYVVMPAKVTSGIAAPLEPIAIVNLEKVFAEIDPATLQKVQEWSQLSIVEEENQKEFLIASNADGVIAQGNSGASFFKADGKSWDITADEDDLCDLSTIKLTFGTGSAGTHKIAQDAKPGKYTLYLVATDKDVNDTKGQEIFRVKVEVEVARPEFSALFTKQDALWKDGKFVAAITPTDNVGGSPALNWGSKNASITLGTAFKAVDNTNADIAQLGYAFKDINGEYPVSNLDAAYNDNALNAISGTVGSAILDKDVIFNKEKNALAVTEITDMVAYASVLSGLQDSQVEFDANTSTADQKKYAIKALQEAFSVTSDAYTTQLKTMWDGISYAYFENGTKVTTPVLLTKDGHIAQYAATSDGKAIQSGFGLELNGKFTTLGTTSSTLWGAMGTTNTAFDSYRLLNTIISGMKLTDVKIAPEITEGSISFDTDKYKVNLANATTATVTFTLTDATGIQYPIKVVVKK